MSENSGTNTPAISLPKGGGAIKGIGETFQPNLFTGTGNFSVPIYTSPGRNNFGPKLSLQYSTGNGNGPFGLGWQLSIPRITRKTEKGLPEYTDDDVFVMSGAEVLVPVLEKINDTWQPVLLEDRTKTYAIQRFRPRTEGLFARIERWMHKQTKNVFWRVTTKENITSVYGKTEQARLFDHAKPTHIYEWRLEETFDAKGNHIYYEYIKDNPHQQLSGIQEQNRDYNQLYIRRILYGNAPDNLASDKRDICPYKESTDHNKPASTKPRYYLFQVLFDYGDLPDKYTLTTGFNFEDHLNMPLPNDTIRKDPFSSFRSRFEVRTLRKCERVLVLHHFNEGELIDAPLVKSTDFSYSVNEDTKISMLSDVQIFGYRKDPADATKYLYRSMPPVSFKYSEFKPQEQRYQSVRAEGNDLPPVSLNHPEFSLIDLFGDGLPDVLHTTNTGYYYWQNKGDGVIDCRYPQHAHSPLPAGVTLGQPNVAIGDMGGDGLPDLIVESATMTGFYEATQDGKWKEFKKLEKLPSIGLSDSNMRLVDLTGDGLSDILVTLEHYFLWFPCLGEKGYGDAKAVNRKHDLDEFPNVYFNDPSARVRLADMTGDGLNDIVLVHDGNISYWPNLGYGKFGRRIQTANAPKIGYNFDPKRLFLSDIDGTGCADLVYVDFDAVHFWFNQSGNGWSEKKTIRGTPTISDMSAIQFTDFYGTGTACIVWSYDYNFQPDGNYKVLDFCGRKKPHLLIEMDNNMGATTWAKYASSTKFYLEDKKEGNPWATHLPFPVQVLEKTEVIDHIGKTKLVTTYKYHHGYYDGKEREFKGFGRVDQWDTEVFEDFSNSGLHQGSVDIRNKQREFHVPPVLTKSWFHTGVYFDEDKPELDGRFFDHHRLMEVYLQEFYQGDDQAFATRDQVFESTSGSSSQTDTPHEIFRALTGALLRSEVYALDDSIHSDHPYMVTQSRYRIKELQEKATNPHAVYLSTQEESISYHYERNPDDPRLGHELNLRVDDFGNVTDKISIGYPRRAPAFEEQRELKILYTKTDFITPEEEAYHFNGISYQSQVFEVTGIDWDWTMPALTRQDFTAVIENANFQPYDWIRPDTHIGVEKRLVEWTRSSFRTSDAPESIDPIGSLIHRLGLGKIAPEGLPFESYTAALTEDMKQVIYGNKADAINLQAEGGYHHEDDYWWIPSGRQAFDCKKFFIPTGSQDPFGNVSTLIPDEYGLLMKEARDPLENVIQSQNDYRVLQPYHLIDPNDNHSAVAFDALGLVVGTAIWGQGKDGNPTGDSLQGFVADLDMAMIHEHLQNPLKNPHAILNKATTRLVYDLNRYQNSGDPNVVYTLAREIHSHDLEGSNCNVQHSFLHSDGFGRKAQSKIQAEAGPIFDTEGKEVVSHAVPRWVGTGAKIYNNKGKPVQEFEPFFSDTHGFGIEQHGVSPVTFYDPLERVICTILPNNTYEKVVFDPWYQETWDTNDTVLLRPDLDKHIQGYVSKYIDSLATPYQTWYLRRMAGTAAQNDAARKTGAHANTPTIAHFDTLGRTFLTIQNNGSDEANQFKTHVKLDIEGNELVITDPRNIKAFEHTFDMASRKLMVDSKDAGPKWMLPDITGEKPIYTWDANQNIVNMVYDQLRRQIETWVKIAQASSFHLAEKTIYGETPTGISNPKQFHIRGQVWKVYDGAGLVTNKEYDFKGNLLETERRLLNDGKGQIRWPLTGDQFDEVRAEVSIAPLGQKYQLTTTFDALNRVTSHTMPDGTKHLLNYNEANLLESLFIEKAGTVSACVENIDYNAEGQRTKIDYANGVTTTYTYEPDTFRLSTLTTIRNGSHTPKAMQELIYNYDPVGNITQIRDDAHPKIFFSNDVIEPLSQYTYDPVYRLIEATGREHESMSACHYQLKNKKNTEFIPYPQPVSNAQAICRYKEQFAYDASGNIELIDHHNLTRNQRWKRYQTYQVDDPNLPLDQQTPVSNRLYSSIARNPLNDEMLCNHENSHNYPHDGNGNIISMPNSPVLQWDFKNQLIEVQLNEGTNPNNAYYQYDSMGQRVRKTIIKNGKSEERIYLGGYEIYLEHNSSGPQFRRDTIHVMDNQNRIALIEDEKDPVTASINNTRVRYQFSNHLDSSILELDASSDAEIISYEEYYPYGGTAYITGRGWQETKLKRYRYSGKERDEETGLYYYGARYYAPWLGRWLSIDPVGTADGLNLYLFVRNNPANMHDFYGLQSETAEVNREIERKTPTTIKLNKKKEIYAPEEELKNLKENKSEASVENLQSKDNYHGYKRNQNVDEWDIFRCEKGWDFTTIDFEGENGYKPPPITAPPKPDPGFDFDKIPLGDEDIIGFEIEDPEKCNRIKEHYERMASELFKERWKQLEARENYYGLLEHVGKICKKRPDDTAFSELQCKAGFLEEMMEAESKYNAATKMVEESEKDVKAIYNKYNECINSKRFTLHKQ